MSRGNACKRWVFTLNNYTDVEEEAVQLFICTRCSYGIYGREVGAEGTEHLQGFIILERKVRLSQLKNDLSDRAHFEPARGTPDESRTYCSKEGDVFEHGECPQSSGRRGKTRDELAKEFDAAMESSVGLAGFKEDNPGVYAFSRHTLLRNYLGHRGPSDRPGVRCRWLFGVPGVGKSRFAHDEMPEAFVKEPCTKWWTGYLLEKQCIIDDFGPRGIGINHLLRWFDRYKCYVETKGDIVPLEVDDWIVTSNFHPRDVYKADDGSDHPQLDALLRRVVLIEFRVLRPGVIERVVLYVLWLCCLLWLPVV